MPRLSILVPICNVEMYLEECLRSICTQTFSDMEIICVDDGSTDSSGVILDRIAMEDDRIIAVHQPNGGYGRAMNAALDLARGEYVGIVESDDWIPSDMMQILYEEAARDHLDLVKADYYRFVHQSDGVVRNIKDMVAPTMDWYNRVFCPREEKQSFQFSLNIWSGIYRREFLVANQIRFHESPGASYQDNGFWFQVYACAERVKLLPIPLYRNRRDNPLSSIHNTGKVYAIAREYDYIRSWIADRFPEDVSLAKLCQAGRIRGYFFTIERIDESYKEEFYHFFGEEMNKLHSLGELPDSEDLDPTQEKRLYHIMEDPAEAFLRENRDWHRLYDCIGPYQDIVIYGAGLTGRKMLQTLAMKGAVRRVAAFAVSDGKKKEEAIGQFPIYEISDISKELCDNALLLLAVRDRELDAVRESAKEHGFKHIANARELVDYSLYSFDIFDTLITRKVDRPEDVFEVMEQQMKQDAECIIPSYIQQDFAMLRQEVEKRTRTLRINDRVKDITLDQIYEAFGAVFDLNKDQTDYLKGLELETEYEQSLPVSEQIQALETMVKNDKRVILVSNMYLSAADIRKLLLKHSSIFQDIKIYVSSEYGKTKGTKTLYPFVAECERVAYAEWKHIGDNQALDVDIPRGLGMAADLVETTKQESVKPDKKEQSMDDLDEINTPYQIGRQYVFPILYPYVRWLLDDAVHKGIETLYFIARDGFLLKEMADVLVKRLQLPVKTKYLYGSRKAWRLPSVDATGEFLEEFLRWNYPAKIYTYEQLAALFDITVEELKEIYPFVREGVEFTPEYLEHMLMQLKAGENELVAKIADRQSDKRKRVCSYLNQEIVHSEKYAFVELIGSGYTQRCLSKLLGDEEIVTYFYRLDACQKWSGVRFLSFFPNQNVSSNILEILCGATHGQTNDYELEQDRWIPVLARDEGECLAEYGFDQMKQGILDQTNACILDEPAVVLETQGRKQSLRLWNYFSEHVESYLHQYVMDMPYSIVGNEEGYVTYAPVLTRDDIWDIYAYYADENRSKYYKGYRLELSEQRMSDQMKQEKEKAIQYRQSPAYKTPVDDKKCLLSWTGSQSLLADEIVLYGAGKYGRRVYEQLSESKTILCVVDQSATDSGTDMGDFIAYSPQKLLAYKDAQIVIAVKKEELVQEIVAKLQQLGIRKSYMLWLQDR